MPRRPCGKAVSKRQLRCDCETFDEKRTVTGCGNCPLSDHTRTPNRVGMLSLPLVTTEALGDPDTDSAWAIGNFISRLCTGSARDIHVTFLIEHVLNKQP